jgi:hypothetical protein
LDIVFLRFWRRANPTNWREWNVKIGKRVGRLSVLNQVIKCASEVRLDLEQELHKCMSKHVHTLRLWVEMFIIRAVHGKALRPTAMIFFIINSNGRIYIYMYQMAWGVEGRCGEAAEESEARMEQ